jgi:hypothetical protein
MPDGVGRALTVDRGAALAFGLVATSLAGFLWFLVSFPKPGEGDTIKATYMAQCLPFLAILGADAVARLRDRWPAAAAVAIGVLSVAALHNVGTAFTRWATPLSCWPSG